MAMGNREIRVRTTRTAAGIALLAFGLAAGCVAIADIDYIEFGPAAPGGTGGTGGSATGGSAAGGSGGSGNQGGAAPTCDDGVQNGLEEGVDCGGPDCPGCDEDCLNGVDDNGDDLTDCADPICAGYRCVPPVPDDWSGPTVVFLAPNDPTLPDCEPDWQERFEGGRGLLPSQDDSCTDCQCGAPSGGQCSGPSVDVWNASNCSGSPNDTVSMDQGEGTCHDLGVGTYQGVYSDGIFATGSSCTLSGGALVPTSWTEEAVACSGAETGGGCAQGDDLCVRRPTGDFEQSACVLQEGEHDCPSGSAYSVQRVVYRGLDDSRQCTPCSCGMNTDLPTCDGTLTVYTNDTCSQGAEVVDMGGMGCTSDPSGFRTANYSVSSGPSGGSCDSSGGSLSGAATPTEPLTLCCLP